MSVLHAKSWIEVDAKAFSGNIDLFERHVGASTMLMLVIKANAYGHGLSEVVQLLKKKKHSHLLGVDSIDEANLVRTQGVKNDVMILGYIPAARFEEAVKKGFHISLYDADTLARAAVLTKKHPYLEPRFHIKIETGTNRLGIRIEDALRIKSLPPIYGIYTHFAEAENMQSHFSRTQRTELLRAADALKGKGVTPVVTHMGATAALIHMPESRASLARLGIGLYGLWPSSDVEAVYRKSLPIQAVLAWKSRLAQVKRVPKGAYVGYDRTYRAPRPIDVGVIPVGYYDGYPRALSGKGEVLIGGKRCPIIGRICMNMMMVDVSETRAHAHDEVVFIGTQKKARVTADNLAEGAGTINYEVVSRINPAIPRIVV